MRLCRFDENRIGLVDGGEVVDVSSVAADLPRHAWPFPLGDLLIQHLPVLRPRIEALAATGRRKPVDACAFLSPVANPSKIIGVGQSYLAHIEEAKRDAGVNAGGSHRIGLDQKSIRFFMKANSALVGPSEGVSLRFLDQRNDPELEFTIVIGKKCTGIAREGALDIVAGYCMGFDMTLRGPEPPSGRKSIDSYAVAGPWLVTPDDLTDPNNVGFSLTVNGEIRQTANTRDLIYTVEQIIWEAARRYTLYPGDIIMTGTPEGVAQVHPGDMMVVRADRIGTMSVPVRAFEG
jgi:2-keto-4-pentenoate hydratase/2-oxohepta-3-ene-1,7-dioic acid hydratase in catechol pathway